MVSNLVLWGLSMYSLTSIEVLPLRDVTDFSEWRIKPYLSSSTRDVGSLSYNENQFAGFILILGYITKLEVKNQNIPRIACPNWKVFGGTFVCKI